MNKTAFGRTGLQVSRLGFGAAPIGFLKTDQDRVARILNQLLDSGVNLIDTAANYEGSEDLIAQAIGHRRAEYVLVSKCGTKLPDIDAPAWSAAMVSQTVDRALRRLKTDHLDVMLLHSCDKATLEKGEALGALAQAREAGKIRFAGYSGDNDALVYAAALPDVAVVETSINLFDQANIDIGLAACIEHQVGVIAKRPIGNAAWLGLENRAGIYANYVKPYVERFQELKLDPTSLGLPDASNASWLELALRFTLSQPGVHAAIIGTTNPDNARANVAVAEKGPLPSETIQQIRQAFQSATPPSGWPAQS